VGRVFVALLLLGEAVVLVALIVLVANLIPLVAPPPTAPTVTIPTAALRDCPRSVPACR
jgi:hypothetical protein